jgi:Bacterial Ig-like domain
MKTGHWFGLSAVVISALQVNACSSEFTSCEATRTCAVGGTVGVGGIGANQAGANDGGADEGGASGAGGEGGAVGAGAGGVGDGGEGSVAKAPTVISVSPLDQAQTADPVKPIVLTFSDALDPKTVTADSVTLKDADNADVPGKVTYTDAVVAFTPDSRLNLLEVYKVDVTTAVTDVEGMPMAEPFSSTFTVRDGVWGKEGAIPSDPDRMLASLQLASDGAGHALAVWTQSSEPNAPTTDVVTSFYDPKTGWAPNTVIDVADFTVNSPAVSMNANGDAVVAWVEASAASNTVQARRYIRGAWDAKPSRLDTAVSQTTVFEVGAAITPTGSVHVVWTSYGSGDFPNSLYTRHATPSGVWDTQPFAFASSEAAVSTLPAIGFDTNGDGFAVYSTSTTPAVVYGKRYLDASATWVGNAIPNATADTIYHTYLALDSSGGAMALWTGSAGGASKVVGSRYDKAWKTPTLANTDAGDAFYGSLVWTGKSFVATWSGSGNVNARDFVTTWGAVSVLSDGIRPASNPFASADLRGNAMVSWEQASDNTLPALVFSRLIGASDTWLAAVPLTNTLGKFGGLRFAVQRDGTAVSAWQVFGQVGQTIGLLSNTFQ